jgi:hypothetical protein
LAAVEEGLTIVEATGEGLCVPELYRVKGELLSMQSPGAPAAEASLRRAREIAVVQSARSLEFRAAISLARFVSRAGNQEEARQIIDETRGWFREEDNPHDVRQADALRAELGTNDGASH